MPYYYRILNFIWFGCILSSVMRRLASWLRSRLLPGGNSVSDTDCDDAVPWDAERAADGSDDDEGAFLMSRLDASVLLAHGFGTTAAERELKDVQQKAEMLAEARRDP